MLVKIVYHQYYMCLMWSKFWKSFKTKIQVHVYMYFSNTHFTDTSFFMTSCVLYFHCELQLDAGAAHVNLCFNRVHMSKGFVEDLIGVKMLILWIYNERNGTPSNFESKSHGNECWLTRWSERWSELDVKQGLNYFHSNNN